jgi:hypothetical protein
MIVRTFDARWLGLGESNPAFWSQRQTAEWLAVAGGWAALLAWIVVRRVGRPRLVVAVFLALTAVVQYLLQVYPPGGHQRMVQAALEQTDFDSGAFFAAAQDLFLRVAREVPPDARVAVIHRSVQPDLPVFLGFLLCPRVFYLFEEQTPPDDELQREGISWVLDVRPAHYRTGYRDAVVRRVRP